MRVTTSSVFFEGNDDLTILLIVGGQVAAALPAE